MGDCKLKEISGNIMIYVVRSTHVKKPSTEKKQHSALQYLCKGTQSIRMILRLFSVVEAMENWGWV